eukprot:scaffold1190_cov157-Isochrysis_galbana.AAC.1
MLSPTGTSETASDGWLWLPAELVNRILLAAIDLDGGTRAAIGTLARVSGTCQRLRECAEAIWRDVMLSLLPPSCAPRQSATPSSWKEAAVRAAQVSRAILEEHAPLPRPSFGHSSVLWQRRVFVFGGRHDETHYGSLDTLDLATRTWTADTPTLGQPPTPRRLHTAVVDDSNGTMCASAAVLYSWLGRSRPTSQKYSPHTHTYALGQVGLAY